MLMPTMRVAAGTSMRMPLIVTRTGSGASRSECVKKKTAVARPDFPFAPFARASPWPSARMQAPSDVIDVSSWDTHSPRVR
jgi:hypothetical protein